MSEGYDEAGVDRDAAAAVAAAASAKAFLPPTTPGLMAAGGRTPATVHQHTSLFAVVTPHSALTHAGGHDTETRASGSDSSHRPSAPIGSSSKRATK